MKTIYYIDRKTGKTEEEQVYGKNAIYLLYGSSPFAKIIGFFALHIIAKWRYCSAFYGWLQQLPYSKRKVVPFVKRFDIDVNEFVDPVESFKTFNDFFIRKLKPEARPISKSSAVLPADARYRFYPEIKKTSQFSVKSREFSIETVLNNKELADEFDGGSLLMARLCPTDCHRFYFPFDCTPSAAVPINGQFYSVNPMAIKDSPWIWGANRRVRTELSTPDFGKVIYMEVGATNVGSIIQTYTPDTLQKKGSEKGYFSFGGSALLIFFKKGAITFDADLLNHNIEVRGLIGESLGSPAKQ